MELLKPIYNEKNYHKKLEKFREKNIPKIYNQIQLMDDLLDDNLDHYISISNRTDGKTFNYVHFLLHLAYYSDVQLLFLSRDFMLRNSYRDLIADIMDFSKYFDINDLRIINNQFYKEVFYKDKTIAFISDLNAATDLKYFSSKLKHIGVIIYDEFLALESDYLPDEWERLKTIYSSVNRNFNLPLLKYPKILYLGNAVNLSSPILAHLDIFSKLENQPVNSKRKYGNICIELRKNTNVNKKRNLRAFDEDKDELTHAQFDINKYNIALDNELEKAYNTCIVKIDTSFLKIHYSNNLDTIILEVVGYSPSYNFNIQAKDNKKTSTYLDDKYYNANHVKKYEKNFYKFANAYSKDYIFSQLNNILTLDIVRVIKEHRYTQKSHAISSDSHNKYSTEKTNYITLSKKAILSKLL